MREQLPQPIEVPAEQGRLGQALRSLRFSSLEIVVLALLGLLVAGGASAAWVRSRPIPMSLAPTSLVAPEPTASVAAAGTYWVHVVGAVRNPGVYELPAGSRAADAVRLAGGLGRHADLLGVNLARLVIDGEQIVVPRRPPKGTVDDTTGSAANGSTGDKININTADQASLESLPGIGPALAQRIIEYRELNGPFSKVEDLTQVSGIGDKTLANLISYITV